MAALKNHNEEVDMKKLAAAALILGTLSTGSVWAHEAGEFFIRAGTATVSRKNLFLPLLPSLRRLDKLTADNLC